VGAFASATTENQIVAALLSFGTMFFLWLIGLVGQRLENSWAGDLMTYVSWSSHFEHLLRGLIDTKDLVYFLSGIALMLFLTHRVVDSTRWK
jgi:gliding motility-associated transport system permease protein